MLEHYLSSSNIPFEIASNASTVEELEADITLSCAPLRMWLPRKQLDKPAVYKVLRLSGIDIGWTKGFDETRFHLRSRPHLRHFIPLSGTAQLQCRGQSFDHSIDSSMVVPANHDHTMAYGANFRSLMLSFDEAVLLRKFRALVDPGAVPDFSRSISLSHPRSRAMMRAIQFALQELEAVGIQTPQPVIDEFSELIILSFLFATEKHFQDGETSQRGSERQLRRVTDYIETHPDDLLEVEKLAALAGTSARTVYRIFKERFGETPVQYQRRIRLSRAKQRLERPQAGDTIIGISLASGFSNVGHFARYYQQMFGERPLETLRVGLAKFGR